MLEHEDDADFRGRICYVPEHEDGHLWLSYEFHAYQLSIDEEWNWEVVQEFEVETDNRSYGIGHDGSNLWVGNMDEAMIRIVDDGILEGWITVEPDEGVIEGNDQEVVVVTLDCNDLVGGEYSAEINITTDADDDVTVAVDLTVIDGPNIVVEWERNYGYPDLLDWNAAHPDLFTGSPYDMVVVVSNNGTRALDIEDIYCENEYFTPDPNNLALDPGAEGVVTITFEAPEDQPGVYEEDLVFVSNDPSDQNYIVAMHAETGTPPVIRIVPGGIEDDLYTGDLELYTLTVFNDGDAPLRFEAEIGIVAEPEGDASVRTLRRTRTIAGPRRDPLEDDELDGLMFCCFQTNSVWGWLDDGMRQDPLLNNDNYHSYRNANDWNEVEFDDYDVICISAYNQQFNQQYQQNLERFEEYIDGGGAAYYETGNANANIRSPGGIYNDVNGGSSNGQLLVSPDPQDDNYSLFAEICHRSEPNYWEEGEIIEGSSWLHARYSHGQFEDGVENGTLEWFQPIASLQNQPDQWGCVAYGFGGGVVMTVGHPSAHCWFNWARDGGQWGSIGAEILLYLTEMSGAGWISIEPTEGEVASEDSMEVIVIIDCTGLIAGLYVADLHFLSNDPADPDVVVTFEIDVAGRPIIAVEWPPEAGFDPDNPRDCDMNWNSMYEELYTETDYSIPVTVLNVGTEVLMVDTIVFEGNFEEVAFHADDDNFNIRAYEELEINFIFNGSDTLLYEYTATIFSNDEADNEEYMIPLIAAPRLPPIISIDPQAIDDELLTGQSNSWTIGISNEGGALLRFTPEIEIIREPGGDRSVRSLRGIGPEADPGRDRRGGPDDQGYEWRDNAEDDGPEFAWLDVGDYENVREFHLGDDANTGRIALGWTFPFWDREYDGIYCNSDSWASFTYAGNGYNQTPANYPQNANDNAMHGKFIMMQQVDNMPNTDIWFWTNESDQAIMWWHASRREHFQLILSDDGRALLQWGQGCGNRNAGVNYGDGDHGFYFGSYGNGGAVAFGPPGAWVSWIMVEPSDSQYVEPNADTDVDVLLDATDMIEGTYEADVWFMSNDPANPEVACNVTLEVIGVALWDEELEPILNPFEGAVDLEFSPTYVEYDTVWTITVRNAGTRPLVVDEVIIEGDNADDFTTDLDAEASIEPDAEFDFTITFAPGDIGERIATLRILSNAQNEEIDEEVGVWWDMVGLGQLPPIALTEPRDGEEIVKQMNEGDEPIEDLIIISNAEGEGRRGLTWEIEIEAIEEQRDASVRALRGIGPEADPGRDRRGGPDDMGYEWRDNQEEDGPEFAWLDRGDFENVREWRLGDDVNTGAVNLGFTFPFWDDEYDRVFLDTDGYMSFTYAGTRYNIAVANFPVAAQPGALYHSMICAQQVDFGNCMIWFWTNESDMAVMWWAGAGRENWQLILHDNGYGVIQWGQGCGNRNAGINEGDGDHGWYLGAYTNGAAVGFGPARAWSIWVTADPMESEVPVPPGESEEVTLTFEYTDDLEPFQVYEAEILITTNAPENDLITIPVTLETGTRVTNWPDVTPTDWAHNINIMELTYGDNQDAAPGWEVAVFAPDDILAGAVVWSGVETTLLAYGDDRNTEEIEGFTAGQPFTFLAWDPDSEVEFFYVVATFEEGPDLWVNNGESSVSMLAYEVEEQTVHFLEGWNMNSLRITPIEDYWDPEEDRGPDIELMLEEFEDEEGNQRVFIMKDADGRFCAPLWGYYGIPFWNLEEGYLFNVTDTLDATWLGAPIPAQAEIPIWAGWNMIAYYPMYDLLAGSDTDPPFYVLSPIIDNVLLAKDGRGYFMAPEWGFSNMPPWTPGQGYQINVDDDVILVYPEEMEQDAMASAVVKGGAHWASPLRTGVNMSVLVTSVAGLQVENGDQIAAFNTRTGHLAGVGTVSDGVCGLAIWGDDVHTKDVVDGMVRGEEFTLRLWDADRETEYNLTGTVKSGAGMVYSNNGFVALDAQAEAALPADFYLSQNYPNPFNAVTRIAYGLPEASRLTIQVFDVTGRLVETLADGQFKAGHYTAVWDGGSLTSGIYIIRMQASHFRSVRKMMLVK